MNKTKSQAKPSGTFNLLETVATNLCRHSVNNTYYGVKKTNGKRRVHCLETTDRKVAERKLADWIKGLADTDPQASNLTMAGLFTRIRAMVANRKPATRKHAEKVMRLFERTFERGMTTPVAKVRASDLAEWLTKACGKMRNRSYNEYRRFIRWAFLIAIADRAIPEPGPFNKTLIPRRSMRQEIIRNIPSPEQFAAILAEMRRSAAFCHPHAQAADFTEFIGVIGVGQAEASAVNLEDIDRAAGVIRLTRVKTGAPFTIPLFSASLALIDRLLEKRQGQTKGRLFTIRDCFLAFNAAIDNLKLPHFTLRNLRSMRIVAWLDAGVDAKQIAEWQGHSDGGKLIWDTYSNVARSNRNAYVAEQIARAEGKVLRFQTAAAA